MKPDRPRILQPVIVNSTFIEIHGVAVTLVCLSTGGYPEQTLDWFLVRHGQTPTRLTNCSTAFSLDNGLYNVTHSCTFTPTYSHDGVTFSCQSSYSGEPPFNDSTEVQFEITRKSRNYFLKWIIPVVNGIVIIDILNILCACLFESRNYEHIIGKALQLIWQCYLL